MTRREDNWIVDGGRPEDKGGECIDCGRPAVHALAQAGRCAPCWAQYVAGREDQPDARDARADAETLRRASWRQRQRYLAEIEWEHGPTYLARVLDAEARLCREEG